MKKSQLLSGASVALLLTFGIAYAQGQKDEHQRAPQAAMQDQSKTGQATQNKSDQQNRMEKSTQQNRNESRSTTGQASSQEQKSGAQHEMNSNSAQSGRNKQSPQAQQHKSSGKAESQKNAAKQPPATEKTSTTGQGSQGSSRPKSASETNPSTAQPSQSSASANKAAQPSPNQAAQPSARGTQSSTAQASGQTQQAQGVSLDPQQQTRVSQAVFSQRNVPRVDRVDFSVNVGSAVPSHVHLVAVPETLIQIYPAWRGDEFFVVRDDIVIVDHSRKIVAVIPGGNRHASSGSSTMVVQNMNPEEIREIQTVLIQRGFLHAKADGKFGPETRDALIAFQRKEGIEATGRIDTRTVSSLGLSGKIQAGGTQGQQGGGAATTGSSSRMSGQNGAPSTSGQNKTPSTTGQNNMPSTSGQNNQNSTSASKMPSKANENQTMTPKARSQPSKNNTTGQGSPSMQNPDRNPSMQNLDRNRDKQKNEAK